MTNTRNWLLIPSIRPKAECKGFSYKHKGVSSVIFMKTNKLSIKPSLPKMLLWRSVLWTWGSKHHWLLFSLLVAKMYLQSEVWSIIKLAMLPRRPKLCMCTFGMEESEVRVLDRCPPVLFRLSRTQVTFMCVECQWLQNRKLPAFSEFVFIWFCWYE